MRRRLADARIRSRRFADLADLASLPDTGDLRLCTLSQIRGARQHIHIRIMLQYNIQYH